MFHATILQPNVVNSQQLIVVYNPRSITTMSYDEKYAFATRMNEVANILKIPDKGHNRQEILGKMFGVSQEAARKWLSGEGFPSTKMSIRIAIEAGVHYEWLMTGRGLKFISDTTAAVTPENIVEVMKAMDAPARYKLVQLSLSLIIPPDDQQNPITNAVDTKRSDPLKSSKKDTGTKRDFLHPSQMVDEKRKRQIPVTEERRKMPWKYKRGK